MTQTKQRIGAVRIDFPWKEGIGDAPRCPVAIIGASIWAIADATIHQWARSAPPAGSGYNKTDFVITYADGAIYEGRLDLQRENAAQVDVLGEHMRGHLRFHGGLLGESELPADITPEQYRAYLAEVPRMGLDVDHAEVSATGEYAYFLERYEVGQP